jgi:hypothetical protein
VTPSEPFQDPGACTQPGRRRQHPVKRTAPTRRRQPRDVCPQRVQLLDGDHQAFVDWFVSYWRQRETHRDPALDRKQA